MHPVRPTPSILLCAMLGSGLCACATPIVATSAARCATLLPAEWKAGVAPAPLPDGKEVGDWIAFGDAQTGKLDTANGRTRDAIGILERCEARDAAVMDKMRRGWFARLFS